MPMVYGDSYGDIANRQLAMDQARDARYFQSLAANRALAAMAQQQQQASMDNAYRIASVIQSQREAQAARAAQAQHWADSMAMDRWKTMLQNQQYQQGLQLQRDQFTDKTGQKDYTEALGAVQQGLVNPGTIKTVFPNLGEDQASRLNEYYNILGKQEEDAITASKSLANNLNAEVLAKKRIAAGAQLDADLAKAQTGWNMPRWLGGSGLDSTLAEESAVKKDAVLAGKAPLPPGTRLPNQQIEDYIKSVLKNKGYADRVQFDDETQTWQPVIQPRRFAPMQLNPASKAWEPVRPVVNAPILADYAMPTATQLDYLNTLRRFVPDDARRSIVQRQLNNAFSQTMDALTAPKTLDAATAAIFFKQAGGNRDVARQLAREAGYTF